MGMGGGSPRPCQERGRTLSSEEKELHSVSSLFLPIQTASLQATVPVTVCQLICGEKKATIVSWRGGVPMPGVQTRLGFSSRQANSLTLMIDVCWKENLLLASQGRKEECL